ncbi:hypothetical protein BCR33DRAFT_517681 [Rhizoclosmatium globosum]|uniref:Transmembrane protein n=1 Tax=Rhizoclosmatium globosum TaxID=329046 RepID=A0A1Y2BII0_9FUNG|nr:hypothetical protein BCR33DRAFT_517681 [Rhizoclosmatium globosum]|eukprot:ORY33905.1 hypothetical protein BCR33DRAFT_517681 [Rhizoclosmatium globosum]
MNSTNDAPSVDTSWELYYNAFNRCMVQDAWITLAVSLIQVILLVLLLLRDIDLGKTRGTSTKLSSPINVLIFSMTVFNCLTNVFKYVAATSIDGVPMVVFFALSSFCLVVTLYSIVLYSWKRGSPVINLLFPSIKSFGVVFLVVLGIVQVAQLITAILANMNLILVYPAISSDWKLMADINYGLTITMDVSMFAFDLFVVLGYLMYLRAVRTAQYPDIQKLQIISRFGLWSCFWLEVYLGCFILFTYWQTQPDAPAVSTFVYEGVLRIVDLGLLGFVFIQLGMKWALLKDEERELKQRRQRIDDAIAVTNNSKSGFQSK